MVYSTKQDQNTALPDGLLLLMQSLSRSGGRFLSPTMRGEFPREVSKDRNHLSGSHIPSGLKIKQHRLHCKAWHRPTLNFAVSYSSSQAASFVLRFRVNKSKQSILECSCVKKIACPNQNLLILFLNYNIISMDELHSLVLHGTKRNDQTIQEFKMQRLHYINYKQLGHPKYFDI